MCVSVPVTTNNVNTPAIYPMVWRSKLDILCALVLWQPTEHLYRMSHNNAILMVNQVLNILTLPLHILSNNGHVMKIL